MLANVNACITHVLDGDVRLLEMGEVLGVNARYRGELLATSLRLGTVANFLHIFMRWVSVCLLLDMFVKYIGGGKLFT